MKLTDIKQDKRNYRKHEKRNLDLIKKSVDEVGLGRSIVIDNDNEIIAGNGLVSTLEKNTKIKVVETDGSELVVVKRTDLSANDEKRRKLAVFDNSTSDSSSFDFDLLKSDFELVELENLGLDNNILEFIGNTTYNDYKLESLSEKFLVPPFSVLRSDLENWKERKNVWIRAGVKSEQGRSSTILNAGLQKLAQLNSSTPEFYAKSKRTGGISIFDPVLCEIMYSWFSQKGDLILDPFAGGSVRGIVASKLGRLYTGIDLSENQIKANIENITEICQNDIPQYICGDSNVELDELEDNKYNMMLSCPPYVDLEKYSDDVADLSNMEYDDFIATYGSIIKKCYNKLKDNSFAVFVVGDVRNKKGNYYNFLGDTINAFIDAGFSYYNELVLVMPNGTAQLRANSYFNGSKKVVKTHQNVLVFVKGDGKKASERIGDVEVLEVSEID